MSEILHHRSKCIGCGACAALCDKFFKMAEDGLSDCLGAKYDKEKAEGVLEVKNVGCSQEAAVNCPVQAIEIQN